MHITHIHTLKPTHIHIHIHTHAAKQQIHSLTQPWNPLRLGDLAKQLIHSAFDLFPISSLQSANWEKQKRKGDCCMSLRDQTKERTRDTQDVGVCRLVMQASEFQYVDTDSGWWFSVIAFISYLISYTGIPWNSICSALSKNVWYTHTAPIICFVNTQENAIVSIFAFDHLKISSKDSHDSWSI